MNIENPQESNAGGQRVEKRFGVASDYINAWMFLRYFSKTWKNIEVVVQIMIP